MAVGAGACSSLMYATDAGRVLCAKATGGGTIAAVDSGAVDVGARQETDAALAARAASGDAGSFAELVQRHQRAVYGIVSRMISDRDDLDDAVQEVFVTAFRSIGSFKGEAAFSTWLFRVAVNTAIKQMRKARVRKSASIDDPNTGLGETLVSDDGADPQESAEHAEKSEAIRRAVLGLPEKHRVVVVLHYFQELPCDEIARIVDCSVGTVWSRLHYACRKLQGQLEWLACDSRR